ncbi:hypothetical protein BAUCODRAFT_572079 [Baudoinia panamericana UAMH 10762]|uniref:Uncharacterized protein n=1 Tax=Baudoinia panamericana (strain UAMH 10762) TaxID=717646 RepID=M2MSI4_BAUPA|nr:uncharacterized protein BAUCODRAFT_572079 [Baudoinia panamericana UAMH 10762]EMC99836.1 hypothetical protein BAUCODRAFT_572079 [Baudoinia panamericana UAMH 10762]
MYRAAADCLVMLEGKCMQYGLATVGLSRASASQRLPLPATTSTFRTHGRQKSQHSRRCSCSIPCSSICTFRAFRGSVTLAGRGRGCEALSHFRVHFPPHSSTAIAEQDSNTYCLSG